MIASTAGDVLVGLIPFVLLFGFWIFLMRRTRVTSDQTQQPLIEKLKEIRHELERLRRAIEERPM